MSDYAIALYIRLSVEDTKTESFSIENQRVALRKHAETLVDDENLKAKIIEFVDNGYSGTNFERPAVQELLELVRANKISCIITKDFTRFGRNSIETGYFIEQVFPLFRTRFISINDDFDTINYKEDTGGIDMAFKYLISEYYSKDLSIKSKSAKYAKMKRGEYQSKICSYGYKKGDNNRLEINGEVAWVVRLIFELSLEGKTAHQIAQVLYDKEIPTPGEYKTSQGIKTHDMGKSYGIWQRSTVLRILDDERYTGTYIMGKRTVTEVGSSRSRLKDEGEWFKIPDHHPAIIDKSVFEQVQSQLVHFKSEKKNRNEYPLRGKVFCGSCDHAMIRKNTKVPTFACRFTKVATSYHCHGLEIKESELEQVLFEIISKQVEVIADSSNVYNIRELDTCLIKQVAYEKNIQNCHDDKRHLYEKFLLREIEIDGYKKQKSVYDTELCDLNHIHSSLALQTAQMRLAGEEKERILQVADVVSRESVLTQSVVDLLIDKVHVFSNNQIEIDWKIKEFCI